MEQQQLEVLAQKGEVLMRALPFVFQIRSMESEGMDCTQQHESLSSLSEEYCTKFSCSISEFAKDLQEIEHLFIKKALNSGFGFGKCHQIPDDLKDKNEENIKKILDKQKEKT